MSYMLLTLVCCVTAVLLGLLFGCFLTPSGEPFDSKRWKSLTEPSDGGKREAMVADLLANHSPVGLSCEDAESLLGNDYYKMDWEGEQVWFYDLGFQGTFLPGIPDKRKLKLTVENGHITKAIVDDKR